MSSSSYKSFLGAKKVFQKGHPRIVLTGVVKF